MAPFVTWGFVYDIVVQVTMFWSKKKRKEYNMYNNVPWKDLEFCCISMKLKTFNWKRGLLLHDFLFFFLSLCKCRVTCFVPDVIVQFLFLLFVAFCRNFCRSRFAVMFGISRPPYLEKGVSKSNSGPMCVTSQNHLAPIGQDYVNILWALV